MKKIISLLLMLVMVFIVIIPSTQAASSRTRNSREPEIIYIYQTVPNKTYSTNAGYPGCGQADIVIGGQIWAACNASSKSYGSRSRSGWFFANDLSPTFRSENGSYQSLEWIGKVTPVKNWGNGPCAKGYRLPTRGEWETVMTYARYNGTSVANILNLPQNGGYRAYKDSDGDVRIEGRNNVAGSYWSSSYGQGNYPILMNLGTIYQRYRLDNTSSSYGNYDYNWQYTDTGLELVGGTSSDIANVRCIKN